MPYLCSWERSRYRGCRGNAKEMGQSSSLAESANHTCESSQSQGEYPQRKEAMGEDGSTLWIRLANVDMKTKGERLLWLVEQVECRGRRHELERSFWALKFLDCKFSLRIPWHMRHSILSRLGNTLRSRVSKGVNDGSYYIT